MSGAFEQAGGGASVVVVETTKGTFAFATFPNDAPATVEHVLALIRARFYDGQRVHRALPGFVVQFGDPQTRDLDKRELWGRGRAAASGKPVGAAEITKKRTHKKGAVAMAHMGDPAKADSQIYVTLDDRPDSTAATRCSARSSKATTCPPRCRSATSSRESTSGRRVIPVFTCV